MSCLKYEKVNVNLDGFWHANVHVRMQQLVTEFNLLYILKYVVGKKVTFQGLNRLEGEVDGSPALVFCKRVEQNQ